MSTNSLQKYKLVRRATLTLRPTALRTHTVRRPSADASRCALCAAPSDCTARECTATAAQPHSRGCPLCTHRTAHTTPHAHGCAPTVVRPTTGRPRLCAVRRRSSSATSRWARRASSAASCTTSSTRTTPRP
eukprot:scaffold122712_cov66-Phaeocystis_antarctica.AAC.2